MVRNDFLQKAFLKTVFTLFCPEKKTMKFTARFVRYFVLLSNQISQISRKLMVQNNAVTPFYRDSVIHFYNSLDRFFFSNFFNFVGLFSICFRFDQLRA